MNEVLNPLDEWAVHVPIVLNGPCSALKIQVTYAA